MNNKLIDQKAQLLYTLLKKVPVAMRMTLLLLFVLTFQLQAEHIYSQDITAVMEAVQQQKKTITGTILDELGVPVIGANIVETGTTNGTVTDIDGNFTLQVEGNAEIHISYIGYLEQSISTAGRSTFNIKLQEDTQALDEVVVVGYGTMRRENLTGSVSQVNMDEVLGDRPVSNTFAALQGSVPGLIISGASTPGQGGKNINIRGTLSINGGSPLILIDNVPGDLNMINPEDIESVSVLKDAASSAIYGARAASGVVLITTKRPSSNTKFQLNYNNNFGFSTSINRPQQASLQDYFQSKLDSGRETYATNQDIRKWMEYLTEYKANPSNFDIIGDGIYIAEDGIPYYLNEKDLVGNMLTTGFYNNHNLSASGGTEKVRYRISGGIVTEDGPFITNKDFYKRINVSSFVSADMTDWFTQELDIRYAQSKNTEPISTEIYRLNLINYYPEGNLPASLTLTNEEAPTIAPKNALLYAPISNSIKNNPRIFLKSIIKPVKDLDIVFEYTYDKDDNNYSFYSDQWKRTSIQLAVDTSPAIDEYERRRYFTDYNSINLYTTYSKTFNNSHNFKLMAGYNQESSFYENISIQVYDQVSSLIPSLGNAKGQKTLDENYSEYSIRSGFYRFNYNYLNKYLVELNGRYDGSSKFPKSDRFGFFPSISGGWQIAREDFMSFSKNWLDELKLRVSWGQIGNQSISPYQFSPIMNINNSSDVWLIDGNKVTTIGVPRLVSSSFTWETVETFDIGIDFSLFDSRLRGTYDWYQRDTKNMLTRAGVVEFPAVVGAEAPAQNGADMRTRGWELAINWSDNIGAFGYNLGLNIFDHQSYITKYANESGLLSDHYVGKYLGEIWGYESDGFYRIDDFVDINSWQLKEGIPSIEGYNVRPGDIKFKNLMDDENRINQINEGNNTIENPGDRKIIGNSTSRYQFGFNLGVNYKGFDISAMLQGVGKRDIWLGGNLMFPYGGGTGEIFSPIMYNQLDYWKPLSLDTDNPNYMIPQNPNPKYYRLYDQVQNVVSNRRTSDKFLQNAAYLRVKNITISYVFPKTLIENLYLSNLKLFASVENLVTFTSLPKGSDPERVNWDYPFYRTSSIGVNITF